jgi:hypothetical protein
MRRAKNVLRRGGRGGLRALCALHIFFGGLLPAPEGDQITESYSILAIPHPGTTCYMAMRNGSSRDSCIWHALHSVPTLCAFR